MTDEQAQFHKLYWEGSKTMTFKEIANEMDKAPSEMSRLYAETKDQRELTKSLRQRWLAKFSSEKRPAFGEFYNNIKSLEEKCCYCGISQVQIDLMYEQGLVETKRSRGAILEIERLLPNESYDNTANLKLACYWCNNAKTDTFSCDEFKKFIAPGIRKVWNDRLKEAGLEEISIDTNEKSIES